MPRSQQEQLYDAQSHVPLGRTFATTAEVQTFVDELRDTEWWQRLYCTVARVEVARLDRRHRHSMAHWESDRSAGLIQLTDAGHRLRTVTHELAHVLTDARYPVVGDHEAHGHDPVFARTYAELVYRLMGSDAWLALRDGYHRYGVEYLETEES